MLTLSHVSKTFKVDDNKDNDRKALIDVSLEVAEGEFLTVIGGNGSGKTTLLNVIAGVFMSDEGSIILNGVNLTKVKEHRRAKAIGRVFQDPMVGTVAGMSVEENMSLALRRGTIPSLQWGLTAKNRTLFTNELSKLQLGLEKRLFTKAGLLSGGQRQALTLVMATLRRPELLLLDEHTAALDPKTAKTVMDLTERLIQEQHLTAIMITHNMKDAIRYGNRLVMMSEGRIILDVKGEEKANLTVEELIQKFQSAGDVLPDDMLLSK